MWEVQISITEHSNITALRAPVVSSSLSRLENREAVNT